MVFNDTTNKLGIIQECETLLYGDNGYGRISGNTNLLNTFVRRSNMAMDHIASVLRKADGRWQWDDINNSGLPIATTNLIANQQDYAIDSTFLEVTRVEMKKSDGNSVLLQPIDQADIYDQALTEYFKTPGTPQYYDKIANSFFLYPAPSYNSTAGLKVYFKRAPSYFTSADTTKTPGFNSDFHILVAYWAAYHYAKDNSLSNKDELYDLLQREELSLTQNTAKRSKDERIGFKVRRQIWR